MAAKSQAVQGTVDVVRRRVVLEGVRPIMFDRYPGDNVTKIEPYQRMYFGENGKTVGLPMLNIISFLSAENTTSAPKRLLDARKYRQTAHANLSFVSIDPAFIPFLREGKPIEFGRFENDKDSLSGIYIDRGVARLKDGIPNPKVRPVLPTPWALEFLLTIYPNNEVQEAQVVKLFRDGGMALGLGTFRGVYGKFVVKVWEKANE